MNVPRAALSVRPSGPVGGRTAAPASKSVTNRALACAALADGESVLRGPLASDDAEAMRGLVEALGVAVRDDGATWVVRGAGGRFRPIAAEANARLSGTTMRFGTALATLASSPVVLTGEEPLLRRPVGPLVQALRKLGGAVEDRDGYPPVRSGGGALEGGAVTVDVTGSSQFASAVLLVAPYAAHDVLVEADGVTALSYVDLTVAAMRAWGAAVEQVGRAAWRVRSGRPYEARDLVVEYDASAACHLFGLAVATGGSVTVTNAAEGSLQPDAGFVAVLETMGADTTRDGDALTVAGPATLRPVRADLSAMPDQVTTLAALAALADGESEIRGVAVARGHETDRLRALATELGKLDVEVTEFPDGLRVAGGGARGPARLGTHDDHRLAMAFAALAAAVPGVVIEEPWCVQKTYPAFWEDAARLGLHWSEVG